jgi:hypothetical protein
MHALCSCSTVTDFNVLAEGIGFTNDRVPEAAVADAVAEELLPPDRVPQAGRELAKGRSPLAVPLCYPCRCGECPCSIALAACASLYWHHLHAASYRQPLCVCSIIQAASASLHSPLILPSFSSHSPRILHSFSGLHVCAALCRQHLHAASYGHLLRAASYRQTRMAAWYGQHLPLVWFCPQVMRWW